MTKFIIAIMHCNKAPHPGCPEPAEANKPFFLHAQLQFPTGRVAYFRARRTVAECVCDTRSSERTAGQTHCVRRVRRNVIAPCGEMRARF